jgi:hypothetical protein
MFADKILRDIEASSGPYNNISPEQQAEILFALKDSNHTGKSMMGIKILLRKFKDNHKDDTDFELKY